MATFGYTDSTNRIEGHQGRLNLTATSLSTAGVLTGTEASSPDDFTTDTLKLAEKRIFSLYDSSNNWKGVAWITSRSSDTNWQLDTIKDRNGDDTFFINTKGESVSVAASDYVLLSGSFNDIDEEEAAWEKNGIEKFAFNQRIEVGAADTTSIHTVLYVDAGELFGETDLTGGDDEGWLRLGNAIIVGGRCLDYSTNLTSAGCSYNSDGNSGRRFEINPSARSSSTIRPVGMWFGGTFGSITEADAGGGGGYPVSAFPCTNSDNAGENEWGASVWMGITTNTAVLSHGPNDDTGFPEASDGTGGNENNIVKGITIKQGTGFAPWQWSSAASENTVDVTDNLGPGSEDKIRGFTTVTKTNAEHTHGSTGTGYTVWNGRSSDTADDDRKDQERYVTYRVNNNSSSKNVGITLVNINSGTYLVRHRNETEHSVDFATRGQVGGRWFNLADNSVIYQSYNFSTAPNSAQNSLGPWSGDNWADPDRIALAAADNGIKDTLMTFSVTEANSSNNANVNVNDDKGWIHYADDTTLGNLTAGEGDLLYSIKAYGYEDINVRPTFQNYGNAGRQVQFFGVEPNIANSFGGGRSGGAEQTRIAALWDGDSMITKVDTETKAATFNGYLESATYESSHSSTDGSRAMTGITVHETTATSIDLTEFLAGLHYETAVYAKTAAGDTLARNQYRQGFSISEAGIIDFDEGFTLTNHASNTMTIELDGDNANLTGVSVDDTDLDLSLFSGDGLSLEASGTGKLTDLPDSIPAWTLIGQYDHTDTGDKTFTFDTGATLDDLTFDYDGDDQITLVNASDVTVTGDSVSNVTKVKRLVVTVQLGEDYDSDKFKGLHWASGTSLSDMQADTVTKVTSADANDDTDNTFTINIDYPDADTRVDFAIFYDGYEVELRSDISANLTVDLTAMSTAKVNFGKTYSGDDATLLGSSNSVTVDAISSATANIVITSGYTAAGIDAAADASRLFLRRAMETDNFATAIVKQYVAADYFNFGDLVVTIESQTEADRLSVTRDSSAFLWFLNVDVQLPNATDLYSQLSGSTPNTYIQFKPKASGMSLPELQVELNGRNLTEDTVTNIGLGVPAWDEADGALKTTPKVS